MIILRQGGLFFLFLSFLSLLAQAQTTNGLNATSIKIDSAEMAHQTSEKKFKINTDAVLLGRSIEDALYKNTYAVTQLVPRVTYKYNSWLSVFMQAEAIWISSNVQGLYSEDGKSGGGVYLDEAAIIANPLPELELRAGTLMVAMNPLNTIVTRENSYLSTAEKYDFNLGNLAFSLQAQQAIPSSGSASKGLVDPSAPSAFFSSQTIKASLASPEIKSHFDVAVTHFEWGNLGANIAGDSYLAGNDPRSFEGIGKANRFRIGFEGFESTAQWQINWHEKINTKLTATYIHNNLAPEDRNSGYLAKIEGTYKINENYSITPYFSVLNMGADVTPAAYNSAPRRYHNREGFIAGTKFDFTKERIAIYGTYFQGNKILPNPYMADREMYTLVVETKHDIL